MSRLVNIYVKEWKRCFIRKDRKTSMGDDFNSQFHPHLDKYEVINTFSTLNTQVHWNQV